MIEILKVMTDTVANEDSRVYGQTVCFVDKETIAEAIEKFEREHETKGGDLKIITSALAIWIIPFEEDTKLLYTFMKI